MGMDRVVSFFTRMALGGKFLGFWVGDLGGEVVGLVEVGGFFAFP